MNVERLPLGGPKAQAFSELKGTALVTSSPREIIRASIFDHPSAQRANNSYASISRTDLVAHRPRTHGPIRPFNRNG